MMVTQIGNVHQTVSVEIVLQNLFAVNLDERQDCCAHLGLAHIVLGEHMQIPQFHNLFFAGIHINEIVNQSNDILA